MSDLEWGPPSEEARVAREGCILRTVVGSQVHGVVRAGTDDRDEMAISIEPPEFALGLRDFKHYAYRTQPEGQPSGPGDLDLIVYGLRRYCELALKGSPTVLLPLFAPDEHTLISTELGRELRRLAPEFIGQRTQESFLGYLESQRSALLAGKAGHGQPRERELSAEHGYDTKYAMHALRIGYQGLELMNEDMITLPIPEPRRSHLLDVRMGSVPLPEILAELDDLIDQLAKAPFRISTPPVELTVEQWLISAYQRHWDETWRPPILE